MKGLNADHVADMLRKISSRMAISRHGGLNRRLQIYKAVIIILEPTNEMMIRREVHQFSR
jgi:hypothetical protein